MSDTCRLPPALIDLIIRQARMDYRPDLASEPNYLKTNTILQKLMAHPPLIDKNR